MIKGGRESREPFMKSVWKFVAGLICSFALLMCAPARAQDESLRIPISFELNTVVLEDVYLDGRGPFRALVDTGSTMNVADTAIVGELKLAAVSDTEVEATGGAISSNVYNGPEIRVSDNVVLDAGSPFIAGPVRKQYAMVEEKIDMVLGAPFLMRYATEYRLDEGEIVLHRPEAFTPPPGAAVVDFETVMNLPVVRAAVEGQEAGLVLDIGSNAAVDLFPQFMERSGLAQRHTIYRVPIIGLGGQVESRLLRVGTVTFGDFEFADVRVYVHAAGLGELDGLIGCEILRRFHFTIDYENKKVYFAPNGDLKTPWVEEFAGITVINELGGYRVTSVSEGSPAYEAGLRAGDAVMEIDGRAAYEVGIPRLRELVRQTAGTMLVIKARRGTNIIEATVTLRNYVQ